MGYMENEKLLAEPGRASPPANRQDGFLRKHRWRFLLLASLLLLAGAGGFEWWTGFVRGRLARAEGQQRYQRGDYAGAVEAFDQAIALWPTHAESYMDRANARLKLGDEEGALTDGDRAAELDPNYPLYRTLTASRYNARGLKRPRPQELDAAIADFRRAHELVPKEAEYRKNLAAAFDRRAREHNQAGRLDEAVADYLESLKLEPDDQKVLTAAATALAGRGLGAARTTPPGPSPTSPGRWS